MDTTINNKPQIFVVTGEPKYHVKPEVVSDFYCAVINVSDHPCSSFDFQLKVPSFWFPINEVGRWGYSPFYGVMRVVNNYWKGDKPVLIHCHAGANRSPSVAYAILMAKDYTPIEAEQSLIYDGLEKVFQRNITRNHIPPNIIEFLKEVNVNQDSLHYILTKMGCLRDEWAQKSTEWKATPIR